MLIRNSSSIRGEDNGISNAHTVHGSESYAIENHIDDDNAT